MAKLQILSQDTSTILLIVFDYVAVLYYSITRIFLIIYVWIWIEQK